MSDFYEEDEDVADVVAAFDRGRKTVTAEPGRPLLVVFDERIQITGNGFVRAFSASDLQVPKFSRSA